MLHDTQEKFGYIPAHSISQISRELKISESEIFGILTFYKAFALKPRGKHLITICLGTACHVRGAPRILDEFERKLGIEAGETTEDNLFTLETVNCVGACALGPIAIADGDYHGQMKTREVDEIIKKLKQEKSKDIE
jgi:NADH-quinone oxidoreductase subunit E